MAAQTFGGPACPDEGGGAAAAGGSGEGGAVGVASGVGSGVGVSVGEGSWGGVNGACWAATPRPTAGTNAGACRPVPADAAAGETLATSAPAARVAPSARRYVRREIRPGMQHAPWC